MEAGKQGSFGKLQWSLLQACDHSMLRMFIIFFKAGGRPREEKGRGEKGL